MMGTRSSPAISRIARAASYPFWRGSPISSTIASGRNCAASSNRLDSVGQRAEFDRLDQVAIDTGITAPLAIHVLAVAGQRDDGNALEPGDQPNRACGLVSILAWQSDIQHDRVRTELRRRCDGIEAVEGQVYLVSCNFERDLQHFRRIDVVVDDQPPQRPSRPRRPIALVGRLVDII